LRNHNSSNVRDSRLTSHHSSSSEEWYDWVREFLKNDSEKRESNCDIDTQEQSMHDSSHKLPKTHTDILTNSSKSELSNMTAEKSEDLDETALTRISTSVCEQSTESIVIESGVESHILNSSVSVSELKSSVNSSSCASSSIITCTSPMHDNIGMSTNLEKDAETMHEKNDNSSQCDNHRAAKHCLCCIII
jgi:hypothetical protein